jgi:hypothetical protein
MKNRFLLMVVVLLGAVLLSLPALAATVTLNQSHQLTVTPTGALALVGVNYDIPGFTPEATVSGDATWLTGSEGPVSATSTTSTAAQYTGSPLVNLSAQNNLTAPFSMTQTLTGNAPGDAGTLNMAAYNFFSLKFYSAAGGAATLGLSDITSGLMSYGVTGQAGVPWFDFLDGTSTFTANIYVDSSGYTDTQSQELLLSSISGSFSDFTQAIAAISLMTFNLGVLESDTFVYLDLTLGTNVYGTSQVPLPPSVLLFGSGLVGLVGLAGFRRRKS